MPNSLWVKKFKVGNNECKIVLNPQNAFWHLDRVKDLDNFKENLFLAVFNSIKENFSSHSPTVYIHTICYPHANEFTIHLVMYGCIEVFKLTIPPGQLIASPKDKFDKEEMNADWEEQLIKELEMDKVDVDIGSFYRTNQLAKLCQAESLNIDLPELIQACLPYRKPSVPVYEPIIEDKIAKVKVGLDAVLVEVEEAKTKFNALLTEEITKLKEINNELITKKAPIDADIQYGIEQYGLLKKQFDVYEKKYDEAAQFNLKAVLASAKSLDCINYFAELSAYYLWMAAYEYYICRLKKDQKNGSKVISKDTKDKVNKTFAAIGFVVDDNNHITSYNEVLSFLKKRRFTFVNVNSAQHKKESTQPMTDLSADSDNNKFYVKLDTAQHKIIYKYKNKAGSIIESEFKIFASELTDELQKLIIAYEISKGNLPTQLEFISECANEIIKSHLGGITKRIVHGIASAAGKESSESLALLEKSLIDFQDALEKYCGKENFTGFLKLTKNKSNILTEVATPNTFVPFGNTLSKSSMEQLSDFMQYKNTSYFKTELVDLMEQCAKLGIELEERQKKKLQVEIKRQLRNFSVKYNSFKKILTNCTSDLVVEETASINNDFLKLRNEWEEQTSQYNNNKATLSCADLSKFISSVHSMEATLDGLRERFTPLPQLIEERKLRLTVNNQESKSNIERASSLLALTQEINVQPDIHLSSSSGDLGEDEKFDYFVNYCFSNLENFHNRVNYRGSCSFFNFCWGGEKIDAQLFDDVFGKNNLNKISIALKDLRVPKGFKEILIAIKNAKQSPIPKEKLFTDIQTIVNNRPSTSKVRHDETQRFYTVIKESNNFCQLKMHLESLNAVECAENKCLKYCTY